MHNFNTAAKKTWNPYIKSGTSAGIVRTKPESLKVKAKSTPEAENSPEVIDVKKSVESARILKVSPVEKLSPVVAEEDPKVQLDGDIESTVNKRRMQLKERTRLYLSEITLNSPPNNIMKVADTYFDTPESSNITSTNLSVVNKDTMVLPQNKEDELKELRRQLEERISLSVAHSSNRASSGVESDDLVYLIINRIECTQLKSRRFQSKNDPFVVLSVNEKFSVKTRTILKGGNAALWDNMRFSVGITGEEMKTSILKIEVFDENSTLADSIIGEARIQLAVCNFMFGEELELSADLTSELGKKAGVVKIFVSFVKSLEKLSLNIAKRAVEKSETFLPTASIMDTLQCDPVLSKYAKLYSSGVPYHAIFLKMKLNQVANCDINRFKDAYKQLSKNVGSQSLSSLTRSNSKNGSRDDAHPLNVGDLLEKLESVEAGRLDAEERLVVALKELNDLKTKSVRTGSDKQGDVSVGHAGSGDNKITQCGSTSISAYPTEDSKNHPPDITVLPTAPNFAPNVESTPKASLAPLDILNPLNLWGNVTTITNFVSNTLTQPSGMIVTDAAKETNGTNSTTEVNNMAMANIESLTTRLKEITSLNEELKLELEATEEMLVYEKTNNSQFILEIQEQYDMEMRNLGIMLSRTEQEKAVIEGQLSRLIAEWQVHDDGQAERMALVETEACRLRLDLENAKKEIAESTVLISELQKDLNESKDILCKTSSENDAMKSKTATVNALQSQVLMLWSTISARDEEAVELQSRLVQITDRDVELEKSVKKLTKDLKLLHHELESTTELLNAEKKKLMELTNKTSSEIYQIALNELNNVEEKLANTEFEKALLQSEVQTMSQALSVSNKELTSTINESEALKRRLFSLRTTEKECDRLKAELTKLRLQQVLGGRDVISGTIVAVTRNPEYGSVDGSDQDYGLYDGYGCAADGLDINDTLPSLDEYSIVNDVSFQSSPGNKNEDFAIDYTKSMSVLESEKMAKSKPFKRKPREIFSVFISPDQEKSAGGMSAVDIVRESSTPSSSAAVDCSCAPDDEIQVEDISFDALTENIVEKQAGAGLEKYFGHGLDWEHNDYGSPNVSLVNPDCVNDSLASVGEDSSALRDPPKSTPGIASSGQLHDGAKHRLDFYNECIEDHDGADDATLVGIKEKESFVGPSNLKSVNLSTSTEIPSSTSTDISCRTRSSSGQSIYEYQENVMQQLKYTLSSPQKLLSSCSSAAKHKAAVVLTTFGRQVLAQLHVRRRLSNDFPRPLDISVISASGLVLGRGMFVDCTNGYVVANTAPLHFADSLDSRFIYSSACTKPIDDTVDPIWNENIRVHIDGPTVLVLSVLHKHIFGEDEFLGQVSLNLANYGKLFRAKSKPIPVRFNLPLKRLSKPVVVNSTPMKVQDREVRGSVTISISVPPLTTHLCGWFWCKLDNEAPVKLWVALRNKKLTLSEGSNRSDDMTIFLPDVIVMTRKPLLQGVSAVLLDSMLLEMSHPLERREITVEKLSLAWADSAANAKGLWVAAIQKHVRQKSV